MNKIKLICFSLAALMMCNVTAGAYSNAEDQEKIYVPMRDAFQAGDTETANHYAGIDISDQINETKTAKVIVDESKMWEAYDEMMGQQCEFADDYNTYYDGDSLKKTWLRIATESEPRPMYRFGGTSANYVNLMLNIGDYSKRKADENSTVLNQQYISKPAYKLGPAERLKAMYANNPNLEFVPCPSPIFMTPEDVENFAHFLYDDENESELGKLRADMGIKNPVNVYYWELGNEVDVWTEDGIEWYTDIAKQFADAIHRVEPNAKTVACGPTAPWDGSKPKENWDFYYNGVMEKLASVVDGISFHPYYDGHSTERMMWIMQTMKNDMDRIVQEQDIRDESGNLKDLVILSTESARWVSLGANDYYKGTCFQSAISYSHFLNNCFQRKYIVGSAYHDIKSTTWLGVFRVNSNGDMFRSPVAKMGDLYIKYLGDRIVSSSIEFDGRLVDTSYNPEEVTGKPAEKFSAAVSAKGSDELDIFITNKDPHTDLNVDFSFLNDYTLVEEIVLKAPNSYTNSFDLKSEAMTSPVATEKNEPHFSSYHMPTECTVVLRLKTKDSLPQLGEAWGANGEDETEEMESGFSDTTNSWAKNEIAKMKELGFVSGKTGELFMPNTDITRAEASVLFSNVLSLNLKYQGNLFNDISGSEWYFPYANAMFVSGILKDKCFLPENNISVAEFCQMASRVYKQYVDKSPVDTAQVVAEYHNIPAEYADCIAVLIHGGILAKLYENSSIDYGRNITRQEATYILYKLFKQL